ncbi:MAG: VOC family protein [Amphiplicatus sp.]
MKRAWTLILLSLLTYSFAAACAETGKSSESQIESVTAAIDDAPLIPDAHWHHIHINSVDPAKSVAYYSQHFAAEPGDFPGADGAVKAQNVWILFDKADRPASTAKNTAIWHIGWGAPDPLAEYKRQKEMGAAFEQPVTDISRVFAEVPPERFYYMYLTSPDGALVELNTAPTNDFGHIHMFSADPVSAGDWYVRIFGVEGRTRSAPGADGEPRFAKTGVQVGPSSSHDFDQVNMIIYPQEYSRTAFRDDWRGVDTLQPTRGTVNDHIGISVPDLDRAIAALKRNGVTILQEPQQLGAHARRAFIEGPDAIAIELLELPDDGT